MYMCRKYTELDGIFYRKRSCAKVAPLPLMMLSRYAQVKGSELHSQPKQLTRLPQYRGYPFMLQGGAHK
jgi:hypothetical protein